MRKIINYRFPMFKQIANFLLELFFPSFCLGCRKEGTFLCADCKATLEISEHSYCLCGKNPLRLPFGEAGGKCYKCRDKKLSGLYSALPYEERALAKKLIRQFKYEPRVKSLAGDLASIMAEHLLITGKNTEKIWQNSVLIPVPLEKSKMKERGYNQSEELAKKLSETIKTPLACGILVKIKKTESQMELSKEEREKNLKGAFLVKNPSKIKGKKVFLIDDVYTTGSTMEECARILRKSGAKEAWGIAIAREG